ncbi:uncharacterized protein LJ206_012744 [Theristicus caerulescens]
MLQLEACFSTVGIWREVLRNTYCGIEAIHRLYCNGNPTVPAFLDVALPRQTAPALKTLPFRTSGSFQCLEKPNCSPSIRGADCLTDWTFAMEAKHFLVLNQKLTWKRSISTYLNNSFP